MPASVGGTGVIARSTYNFVTSTVEGMPNEDIPVRLLALLTKSCWIAGMLSRKPKRAHDGVSSGKLASIYCSFGCCGD